MLTNFQSIQLDFEESIRSQDEPGILRSRDYFNILIKEEMDKGIKPSRIVLGGFSQGGAMSVFSGVTNKEKLGGVFGLSCYMLLSDRIKNYMPEDLPNKNTPFFLGHGEEDEVVNYQFGKMSAKMLKELGLEDVSFNTYPYVQYGPLGLRWYYADSLVVVILVTLLILLRLMILRSSWRRRSRLTVTVKRLLGYESMNVPLVGALRTLDGDTPWCLGF